MTFYLTVEEVLALHKVSIQEFGGIDGLRDLGLLESSVAQPQQTFGGDDLYVSVWDKAAIIAYSLSENQAFLDGNKRTAALSMMVFLDINGFELDCARDEVYETIMKVANKTFTREQLAKWLQKNSKKIKK